MPVCQHFTPGKAPCPTPTSLLVRVRTSNGEREVYLCDRHHREKHAAGKVISPAPAAPMAIPERVVRAAPASSPFPVLAELVAAAEPTPITSDEPQASRWPAPPTPTCPVPGCERGQKRGGLCRLHHARALRAGVAQAGATPYDRQVLEELAQPIRRGPRRAEPPIACLVEGCDEPSKCRGLCKRHYQRASGAGFTPKRGPLAPEHLARLASPTPIPRRKERKRSRKAADEPVLQPSKAPLLGLRVVGLSLDPARVTLEVAMESLDDLSKLALGQRVRLVVAPDGE